MDNKDPKKHRKPKTKSPAKGKDREGDKKPKKSSSKPKETRSGTPKSQSKTVESPMDMAFESLDTQFDDNEVEFVFADDDVEIEDGGLADPNLKQKPWKFCTTDEFLEQILGSVLEEIGPYVPFADSEDEELKNIAAWKCLTLLQGLECVSTHFDWRKYVPTRDLTQKRRS
eukprot:TRINITY_DN10807_c0_g1_i4.p1 TRINITY_DN10807_c0_g1~~TRINITY_DN10807_c0_g1_i4.p1  ORF type:complete len:171 (-),score=44.85 TRINITY_DN10807_c0_g1_i4:44-556(-)